MKRIVSMIIGAVMVSAVLSGCGAQESNLVSKEPFPKFSEVDTEGNTISNDIFADYDATIVNFWNNGCGTCIEEMPELEEMYHNFKEQNVNLIGVGADSGESDEQLATAQKILTEKGVTYSNISPNPENDFYKDFISEIAGYPTTYIVDREGNIVGSPIIGYVKKQIDTLQNRIDTIKETEKGK
ncbi:TlpA family protein disulfide reductase [Anaerotruncus colihominis]|uniref:TlpA family protein disulfide reductase n=1 Tax=Anaerotruncus colihominis TaxID=169435 RepID=UPI0018AC0907|nr:TlpA disulfide reductase family protein [Anaerotruncus colihominis]